MLSLVFWSQVFVHTDVVVVSNLTILMVGDHVIITLQSDLSLGKLTANDMCPLLGGIPKY